MQPAAGRALSIVLTRTALQPPQTLAVPSCLTPAGNLAWGNTPLVPCACASEWDSLLRSSGSALEPYGDRVCLQAGGASLEEAMENPAGFAQMVLKEEADGALEPVDGRRNAHVRVDGRPLSACPGRCSWRGACVASRAAGAPPVCVCESRLVVGRTSPDPEHNCSGSPPPCMNACRGRGACVEGVCVCRLGYWGLDCSSVRGPDSQPALADSAPLSADSAPPLSPSIFVYDLPAVLSAWPTAYAGWAQDFARFSGASLLAALLRSRHRTADAEAADFYVLPVHGGVHVRRLDALRHVAATWPYFNASVAAGLATHLLPTMAHDNGIMAYAGVRDALLSALHRQPLRAGQPWAAALPPALRHTLFLAHNGLHLGQLRGTYPGRRTAFWTPDGGMPPDGEEALRISGGPAAGGFVPGKDIVMPEPWRWRSTRGRESATGLEPTAAAFRRQRCTSRAPCRRRAASSRTTCAALRWVRCGGGRASRCAADSRSALLTWRGTRRGPPSAWRPAGGPAALAAASWRRWALAACRCM